MGISGALKRVGVCEFAVFLAPGGGGRFGREPDGNEGDHVMALW